MNQTFLDELEMLLENRQPIIGMTIWTFAFTHFSSQYFFQSCESQKISFSLSLRVSYQPVVICSFVLSISVLFATFPSNVKYFSLFVSFVEHLPPTAKPMVPPLRSKLYPVLLMSVCGEGEGCVCVCTRARVRTIHRCFCLPCWYFLLVDLNCHCTQRESTNWFIHHWFPFFSFLFFSLFHLLSRCHPRVLVYERVCNENTQSNKSHPAKKKRSLFFQMKFNSSTSLWILVFVLICLGNVISAGFVRSFTPSSSTTDNIVWSSLWF